MNSYCLSVGLATALVLFILSNICPIERGAVIQAPSCTTGPQIREKEPLIGAELYRYPESEEGKDCFANLIGVFSNLLIPTSYPLRPCYLMVGYPFGG